MAIFHTTKASHGRLLGGGISWQATCVEAWSTCFEAAPAARIMALPYGDGDQHNSSNFPYFLAGQHAVHCLLALIIRVR
jgi:hypothetical protein